MFETTNQFIEFLPHPFGQLGLLFPIHGKSKKKHVPNHQPDTSL